MTLYAKISNGEVIAFPYTDDMLKADNRDVSFPADLDDETRGGYDMLPVAPAEVPRGKVSTGSTAELIESVWTQVHALEDAPPPSTDPADYPLLPWQFKAMVIYLDVDALIRAAIGQIPDAMQRAATLSRYENSTSYRFDDPLVGQLRQAIGMAEEDLIDAWLLAKELRST